MNKKIPFFVVDKYYPKLLILLRGYGLFARG
jgi:hypothetical protein